MPQAATDQRHRLTAGRSFQDLLHLPAEACFLYHPGATTMHRRVHAVHATDGSGRNAGEKIMTEETGSREAPADVHALLERIDEAWRQLFAALDDILMTD